MQRRSQVTSEQSGSRGGSPSRQVVAMPRLLRQRVRMWSAFLDRDVSDVVREAVTEYLDRLERGRAEQGLPPFPIPSDGEDTVGR